jgi:hypothetical protein
VDLLLSQSCAALKRDFVADSPNVFLAQSIRGHGSRVLTRRIMAAIASPILHVSVVTRTFLPEFRRYGHEERISGLYGIGGQLSP